MDTKNLGLSKKTNVAIASISGIAIAGNMEKTQAICSIIAITLITCYHLTIQGKLDKDKK